MGSLIIGLFVLIFIVLPILWAIVDEDMTRSNKKVEDYYKQKEKELEDDYKKMYTFIEEQDDTGEN